MINIYNNIPLRKMLFYGLYEQKTKDELLINVENLEKKVEKLSSELSSLKTGRFREKYSTRILDALPDMQL